MAMTANYSDTNTLRRRNHVTAKVRELVPVEMNLFGGTGTENKTDMNCRRFEKSA